MTTFMMFISWDFVNWEIDRGKTKRTECWEEMRFPLFDRLSHAQQIKILQIVR